MTTSTPATPPARASGAARPHLALSALANVCGDVALVAAVSSLLGILAVTLGAVGLVTGAVGLIAGLVARDRQRRAGERATAGATMGAVLGLASMALATVGMLLGGAGDTDRAVTVLEREAERFESELDRPPVEVEAR